MKNTGQGFTGRTLTQKIAAGAVPPRMSEGQRNAQRTRAGKVRAAQQDRGRLKGKKLCLKLKDE